MVPVMLFEPDIEVRCFTDIVPVDCLAVKYVKEMRNPLKNKKTPRLQGLVVVPPGIEPGTHGFSVHCSTN